MCKTISRLQSKYLNESETLHNIGVVGALRRLTILLLSCLEMVTVASLMAVCVISWKSQNATQPSFTSTFWACFCFPSNLFFFDLPFSLPIPVDYLQDIHTQFIEEVFFKCQILSSENYERWEVVRHIWT